MPQHYLVDGYNVLHYISGQRMFRERISLDNMEASRNVLIDLLLGYVSLSGHRMTVVFDGAGSIPSHAFPTGTGNKFAVLFSSRRHSADSIIEKTVRNALSPREIVVVTNDIIVRDQCASRNALVMSVKNFLATLHEASSCVRDTRSHAVHDDIKRVTHRMSSQSLERLEAHKRKIDSKKSHPHTKKGL